MDRLRLGIIGAGFIATRHFKVLQAQPDAAIAAVCAPNLACAGARAYCRRPPPGCVVGMAYGHKTGHDADPAQDFHVLLADGIEPMAGIWAAQMGPICANERRPDSLQVVFDMRPD